MRRGVLLAKRGHAIANVLAVVSNNDRFVDGARRRAPFTDDNSKDTYRLIANILFRLARLKFPLSMQTNVDRLSIRVDGEGIFFVMEETE